LRPRLLLFPALAQSQEKSTQLLCRPSTTAAGGIMGDSIVASLGIAMTGGIAIATGGAIDTRGTTVIATIAGIGGIDGTTTTATETFDR